MPWNPSDKDAAVTLSNGNLTASGSSNYPRVRATLGRSTGKFYFEGVWTGRLAAFGITTGSTSLSAFLGSDAADWSIFGHNAIAFLVAENNNVGGSIAPYTYAAGHVFQVAVDLDAQKIWFGYDGTWLGTGSPDPAAGTDPAYSNLTASTTFYPAWSASNADTTSSVDAHFLTGSFTYSPPSGFAAWETLVSASAALAGAGSTSFFSDAITVASFHGAGSFSSVAVELAKAAGAFTGVGAFNPQMPARVAAFAAAGAFAGVTALGPTRYVSFGGRTAFGPTPVVTHHVNWLNPAYVDPSPTGGFNAGTSRVLKTTLFTYQNWGTGGIDVPELSDGTYTGAPWVADGATALTAAIAGTTKLVDRIVIWSTADPHNQLLNPTFAEPGEYGLIGNSSGQLRIEVYGSGGHSMSYGDGFGGGSIYAIDISNNRATRLEVVLPTPMNVGGVFILGGTSGSRGALRAGTIVQEVELLHTYTAFEASEISTADAISEAIRVTKQAWISTANATAPVVGNVAANLISSANATATDASSGKHHEILTSSSDATAEAIPILTAVATSTADSSATLTSFRPLTLESTAVATAVMAAKITHTEVSTADSESPVSPLNNITQTEESSGAATDTVTGLRIVTVTEVSTGDSANADTSKRVSRLTLLSEAIANTAIVLQSTQTATEVSIAAASASIRLPASSLPIYWTNTMTMAAAIWEGLPFNSLIELEGESFAADTVGVRKLVATGDDLTATIESEIAWDLSDYGSSKKKRLRSAYVDGIANGPFRFRVIGEQGGFDYQTHLATAVIPTNHRAPLGRGWSSLYYRFGLLQDNYFSVSGIIVQMGDTTRRI